VHGPTILVVEDEQLVALDIEKRLEPLGYAVATASTGEEAVDRIRTLRPDLVLMDIKLNGGMDGIEAAQKVHAAMDVPVIYLTAYADEATLDRARMSKPYGYVLKPFDARELKATIEMALQRHWSDRHRRQREEMQRFLADTSAQLAESLDYHTVISRAADLIVPRFADSCLICLKQSSEAIPPFTLIRPAPHAELPPQPAEPESVVAQVLESARPQLYSSFSVSESLPKLLGREHLEALREQEITPESLLCVPLIARRRILGAFVFVSGRGDRRYGPFDLALAEDFAHRLSMAIDNALLYREAQRASHMREEDLAIVSHDLRNPLATILMRAQILARSSSAPGLQAIVRTAHRMNRLIGDLLDAASLDAGRLSFERQAHSAGGLVHDAVETLRPLAEERSITLVEAPPNDGLTVLCHQDRIVQVLSNLIGNAIKFTPRGGQITVHVEPHENQVRFGVTDTGPGVPPDQIGHLFERFWRGQARREGAGLGLYIAKGIVEAHGGLIWVENNAGGGSSFSFTLPAAPPGQPGDAPP
jgi:signal transduction histidine kinase/CheY-like chemotaxis protein